ncbi:FAD-dependent oxidoreductase [Tsukamurella strandjordii]|uniref:NAD(P)/FAD-dependent oxidoreductase n=1 Tax=Tsukamurella strandjordii TaxID=147577 RepID=A0AA90SK64_9ACTN|nr:NAD(P)/FAD-dependent oxidoreductase [Tsukamurella strandjordii]MDP0396983.1 NAD(P)/FAD-dependent oxidoreductase [Tsukamurella strandjordii]
MNRNVIAENPEVAVIGGGPVGLMLGCLLRSNGVDALVVDRPAPDSRHSKATLIWPRSLEVLEGAGVSEAVVAAGHRIDAVTFSTAAMRLRSIDLGELPDTRYRFGVSVRQSVVEDILRHRFVELGGTLVSAECTSVADAGDHADITLTTSVGIREISPAWVVGADGVRSTVRAAIGAEYRGYDVPARFVLADTALSGRAPRNEVRYYFGHDGSLAVGPIGDDLYRIAWSVQETPAVPVGIDDLTELIRVRSDLDVAVEHVHHSADFRAQVRHATTFRAGRLILAGDSAHRMTPASGQGMNTGFGDAAALGWRLSAVLAGRLAESSLDDYAVERAAAARQIEQRTSAQSSRVDDWTVSESDPGPIPIMSTAELAQFDVGQRVDVNHRGLGVGLGIPVAPAAPTVVCWPGSEWRAAQWARSLAELDREVSGGARIVDASRLGNSRPPGLQGDQPGCIVITPDGLVTDHCDVGDVPRVLAAAGWR